MIYHLELSDEALQAIGSVSAQWAVLECYLARTTIALASRFGNPTSWRAEETAFMQRRTAFHEALEWSNVPPSIQEQGIAIWYRMTEVEQRRHMIVHGMAGEFGGDPQQIHFSRAAPEKYWFSERLSIPQIFAIAEDIARVNGDLAKLFLDVWLSSDIAP